MTATEEASLRAPIVERAVVGFDLLAGSETDESTGLGPSRPGRVVVEMIAAAMVAGVVSVAVQWLVSRLHIPMPSFGPQAVMSFAVAVLSLAGLALAVFSRFAVGGRLMAWSGLAALCTVAQSLTLLGTKYYLAGINGDQLFRIQYLTRLADTAGFDDFAYQDLPAYYPRGWFWVGGRMAALLHVPAWEFYKPYAIATMAVGTVLAYVAWCLVVRPAAALLIGLTMALVAVVTWAANEPYAWIFGSMITPLAVVGWRYLTDRSRSGTAGAILLGTTVGLLGLFYTLLMVFFVLVLVTIAGIDMIMTIRRRESSWRTLRRPIVRLAKIAAVSLPWLALQWVPYLAVSLKEPTGGRGALHFLPSSGAVFPISYYPTSFTGVMSIVGLIWGLFRLRESVVARSLVLVIACCYAWYGLSFLLTVVDLTLLPFKVGLVLEATLLCAGVLGTLDFVRWACGRLAARWRTGAVLVVIVFSMFGFVGEMQQAPTAIPELTADPYNNYYPSGVTALGRHDPAQDGAWNQNLHDTVARLTGRAENRLTVLSTYPEFAVFYPYWSFEASKVQYANPLGHYDARRSVIESWAAAPSPDALLDRMRSSRFGHPDVFVLRTAADGLHLSLLENVFPKSADNVAYDVVFPARLFDSPAFVSEQVGPFTVLAVR
ncbi:arabinofuranosyltransferase [Streptomyces sp. MN03-5084-2B]|nr:arabinofuranosyltransferase [Streptomyces sp. MN03-5084-2B]